MTLFIIRRLLQSIVVLLIMSLVVFVGVFAIGDPVEMLIDPAASDADRANAMRILGLDRPLHEQYLLFIRNALNADLGKSFVFNVSAIELVLRRLPATIELTLVAMLLSVGIGLPLGIFAGIYPNSRLAKMIVAGSILGFSLPAFWFGLMMILVFAVILGWLPSTGRGETVLFLGYRVSLFTYSGLLHLIMPAITMALFNISLIIRLARAGMREVLQADYIKFARAKGLRRVRVIGVHALRNILIPIVTVIGLEFGSLLAGSIVTETVFAWPGVGRLVIISIQMLDRPVIVAYMLVIVSFFVVINLIVDISYTIIDPRVRLGEGRK